MAGSRFNPNDADKLISTERKELIPSNKVIEMLDLSKNDTVADLGAGNGYFTIPIAKGMKKPVYAVDIESKMLGMLKEKAVEEQIDNINYVVSDLENIQLDKGLVNKALIAFVIHEVPNLDKALCEIKRILKPEGQLLLLEWEAVETEIGPPFHEKIPSEKMGELLRENGFDIEVTHLNSAIYVITAKAV
ncbi:methyltransferase domain-containing protein [Aquibacillus sp. 3ASR75-11]|uniref:Methyltransferase domain-containing protein n=1 Tax=Terrihalobacillus insolitus TaxID=2950438 RepID=A0A9X3WV11_9BACI|nr:methyltransferase domain-containing protein [Terrihalobacillus insolitus]MDC3414730.1 methyltransferase domain-containing protein [Terrihalobacillus insolitus]MDC3426165.1 methyltransferase domain-containing protein [Terrihalobacillus insolitus]